MDQLDDTQTQQRDAPVTWDVHAPDCGAPASTLTHSYSRATESWARRLSRASHPSIQQGPFDHGQPGALLPSPQCWGLFFTKRSTSATWLQQQKTDSDRGKVSPGNSREERKEGGWGVMAWLKPQFGCPHWV